MKQVIRYNTFETNSSSMHSLVVANNPKPYTRDELLLGHHGASKTYNLFYFNNDDEATFTRYPFQVLSTPVEKLRYYVAHEIGNCEKKNLIPKIKKFISKQTGVAVSNIEIGVKEHETKKVYYGYVEHNDTGESPFEFIDRKKLSMEEFVLNPKYIVIIDGDEYCEFKKLFERNIIQPATIEDISSGIKFWTRPYYVLGRVTLESLTPEEIAQDINDDIQAVCVHLEADDAEWYKQNLEKIKAVKQSVLASAAPGAKFVLQNYSWIASKKKLTKKKLKLFDDTSVFDDLDLKSSKYVNSIDY